MKGTSKVTSNQSPHAPSILTARINRQKNLPNQPMTSDECPRFDHCGAMLCPLSLEDSVWLSDEEICKLSDFQNTTLIRTQKKIQRRRAPGVLTKAMLDRKIIVGKSIKGLRADEADRKAEDSWIRKHKKFLKVMTDEQKHGMVSRLRLYDAHSKRSSPRSVGSVNP